MTPFEKLLQEYEDAIVRIERREDFRQRLGIASPDAYRLINDELQEQLERRDKLKAQLLAYGEKTS